MISSQNPILSKIQALPGRTTRAVIDLNAIAGNVRSAIETVGASRPIRAVVKADGYGHGAVMVAREALAAGATNLAVATVGELATLRATGIQADVLILGPIDASEIDRTISLSAELTLADVSFARKLAHWAEALGTRLRVHAKVDTGMHRFGAAPEDLAQLIAFIDASESLELVGVETHHAMADDPESPDERAQIELFNALIRDLELSRRPDLDLHHANSCAAIGGIPPVRGSVRLGIALYGLQPGPSVALAPGMKPAMSVISRIARLHEIRPGEGVSYGHVYRAAKNEIIGLVPIGYADGYKRSLSNKSWMSVQGAHGPVRGRVCMDQTVIGNLDKTTLMGDLVGIAGPLGGGPSFDEIATWAGTINYEIATSWGSRVPRYYVRGGEVVATLIEGICETW